MYCEAMSAVNHRESDLSTYPQDFEDRRRQAHKT
jgi:hypothetical protein